MEKLRFINLDFSFLNGTKVWFKIAPKRLTAQLISFKLGDKFFSAFPKDPLVEPGTVVSMHVRFSEHQVFQFFEDFKKSESVPDIIEMNNVKDESDSVVITLYPIAWTLSLETNDITPYYRVEMTSSEKFCVRAWRGSPEGYFSFFDLVEKKKY